MSCEGTSQHSYEDLGLSVDVDAASGAVRDPYYRDIWSYLTRRSWTGAEHVAEFGGASNGIVRAMLEAVGCRRYEHLPYPAVDLLRASSLPRSALDVAILDEILEHVSNPFLAAANLRRALRPGGMVLARTYGSIPSYATWRSTPGLSRDDSVGTPRTPSKPRVGCWTSRTRILG